MFFKIKLKGGALYVSVIISILISIILALFITIAYYNTRTIQSQSSLTQLQLSLESGFEVAKSSYYNSSGNQYWQKMTFNNDSVKVKKIPWGCFTLIDVKAKNKHYRLQKTGLFGTKALTDTALFIVDNNKPIGVGGKMKFKATCFLPKHGIKSAYIDGVSFSDLNSLRPFIKPAPSTLPKIDEDFLGDIEQLQSKIDPYSDSLITYIPQILHQSFQEKTVVVHQQSIVLAEENLSQNIKLIANDVITVDNSVHLENVLLLARKVVFKKGFKGSVHVIAKDSIVSEDECEFAYPSSFCVYNNSLQSNIPLFRGIFFGEKCKFSGGILAINDKRSSSKMKIRINKGFQLIGNIYSSNYAEAQGNIYGSIFCETLLLQTSSTYENYIFNCLLDPKKYNDNLAVPDWFNFKDKKYVCAKWF